MPEDRTEILEDVRLLFRNFEGKEGQYNTAGNRNFNVLLWPEKAEELIAKGYNVRSTKDREGDEGEILKGEPIIEVKVNFGGRPPAIIMISKTKRTHLDESTVALLDYADITHVDLMFNPYKWDVGGKSGIKAYLTSIYVTVNEDYLAAKYSDVNTIDDMQGNG